MCVCVCFVLGNIRFKDLEYSVYFDVFRFRVSHTVGSLECFASSAAAPISRKHRVDECKNDL